jgi:hypothetical protein
LSLVVLRHKLSTLSTLSRPEEKTGLKLEECWVR